MNRKVTLRDIQKADTHQRLLDAASRVFDREGFDAATVDQIASEAGASRPTFYAHFKDKQQVLAELMDMYRMRALPFIERFPGPNPTVGDIKIWLHAIGSFLEQEKELFSLLNQTVGHRPVGSPHYGLEIVDAWISGLATRSEVFAKAKSKTKTNVSARAWAELLVIEIVWAASNVLAHPRSNFTRKTVEIVALSLHRFINEQQDMG